MKKRCRQFVRHLATIRYNLVKTTRRINMKNAYWLDRWQRDDIGFHQNEINPYLPQYWQQLYLAPGSRVFVPLCGKSHDLMWLHEQGHEILGVELSPVAARAFFDDNGLIPKITHRGQFECLESNGIQIWCGDIFDLTAEDLTKIQAVYDRAALVALPPTMRQRYVSHLLTILPATLDIFLITLDYPQHEMPGPPFAVSADEIESLYARHAAITCLQQTDVLAQNPRFQERGLSRLQERVYKLKITPKKNITDRSN